MSLQSWGFNRPSPFVVAHWAGLALWVHTDVDVAAVLTRHLLSWLELNRGNDEQFKSIDEG